MFLRWSILRFPPPVHCRDKTTKREWSHQCKSTLTQRRESILRQVKVYSQIYCQTLSLLLMMFHVVWQQTAVHLWHPHSSFSFLWAGRLICHRLHPRQNNNTPARCDGQPRRGGDSFVVSGHRLKVERRRRTLTFPSGVCSRCRLSCLETLRPPPAIKHLRPKKRFFKASHIQKSQDTLEVRQHCDLLDQRASFQF